MATAAPVPYLLALSDLTAVCKGGGQHHGNLGTSGATAYVSGVAARLMSMYPATTACQIEHALKATALPVQSDQTHRSRAGLIQPDNAAIFLQQLSPCLPKRCAQPLALFRDSELEHSMRYLPSSQYVSAILYARPTARIGAIVREAALKGDAVRIRLLNEAENVAFVATTKDQLTAWWDDKRVLMISGVG